MNLESLSWYHFVGFVILAVLILNILRSVATRGGRRFQKAVAAVHGLGSAGRFKEALEIGHAALKELPPPSECRGKLAEFRFLLAMLVSDITRKATFNAKEEYDLLMECTEIMAREPRVIEGPSTVGHGYLIQMNLGNAAARLKRFSEAAQAHQQAYLHARTDEHRCKSIVYEAWDILGTRDENRHSDVKNRLDKIGQLVEGGHVPRALRSSATVAQAALDLYDGDLIAARNRCAQALGLDENDRRANRLDKVLLEPDVTPKRALDVLLDLSEPDDAGPERPKSLAPLPEGV